MTYVLSDIHGEFDKYEEMLSLIGFSADDSLYIIGDIADRGTCGVDIALDAMKRNNVFLIRGNHEQMCIDTLGPYNKVGARQLWEYNGGGVTFMDLKSRPREEFDAVLAFFQKAPLYANITVNGRNFHLVHGCPSPSLDEDTMIWGRPTLETKSPWPDTTVIVGHTPTINNIELDSFNEPHLHIWHGDHIIDIDCGCGHMSLGKKRRLACLRLDDMEEFYV